MLRNPKIKLHSTVKICNRRFNYRQIEITVLRRFKPLNYIPWILIARNTQSTIGNKMRSTIIYCEIVIVCLCSTRVPLYLRINVSGMFLLVYKHQKTIINP